MTKRLQSWALLLTLLLFAPGAFAAYCGGVPDGTSVNDVSITNCLKLPGTFTIATLPNSTSIKIGVLAYTSDGGVYVKTGAGTWTAVGGSSSSLPSGTPTNMPAGVVTSTGSVVSSTKSPTAQYLGLGVNGAYAPGAPYPSCTGNCDVLIGVGAGALLNSADYLSTAVGFNAMAAQASANSESTAVGWNSQGNVNLLNAQNTTVGVNTLGACTTGCQYDIAIGTDAMRSVGATSAVTTSTAVGAAAMFGGAAWTGANNVAVGNQALHCISCTTASDNVVVGASAMGGAVTTASQNFALGSNTGFNFTTDTQMLCIGYTACQGHGSTQDTLVGPGAGGGGAMNNSADYNVGIGQSALYNLTSGSLNTAVGYNAGSIFTDGFNNVCLGNATCSSASPDGANNIIIGGYQNATGNVSNQINIGGLLYYNNTSVAAPAVSACGTSPSIDTHANNKSGTVTSGSGALASCTVTLAGSGYATWNHCRVTPHQSAAAFAYSYTKTVLTVTATSLTSEVFDYDCDGY